MEPRDDDTMSDAERIAELEDVTDVQARIIRRTRERARYYRNVCAAAGLAVLSAAVTFGLLLPPKPEPEIAEPE